MIKLNGEKVEYGHFPDGTLLIKKDVSGCKESNTARITWLFENNEELVTLIFLTKHLRSYGIEDIYLYMPYIPNARQDRVKTSEDVFTLKYFTETINWLNFKSVTVLDPHSNVSEALIDRINVILPEDNVKAVIREIEKNDTELILFFPDAGACKRYADMFPTYKYIYGNKKREWGTGKILGTEIVNPFNIDLTGKRILIIDDICSKGTTFVKSAEALEVYSVKEIFLYITHCENTILEGEVLTSGLINRVFTTNSIFTKEHEKIIIIK